MDMERPSAPRRITALQKRHRLRSRSHDNRAVKLPAAQAEILAHKKGTHTVPQHIVRQIPIGLFRQLFQMMNVLKHSSIPVLFTEEGEVSAVLQIVHGMVEFIGRYEEFAQIQILPPARSRALCLPSKEAPASFPFP